MATIERGLLIRDDVAWYDGVTRTASRLDATGGTITGLNFGDEVDVLQVFGSGTNRTLSTINDAITRLGGANATLLFSTGTWTITDDLTIPLNVTCHIPYGCLLEITSGKTLTINGYVQAGQYQIFSGSGSAAGLSKNPYVTPIWWQENTTPGTTNMTTAIQATIDSNTKVFLPDGIYSINADLTVSTDLFFEGAGFGTIIKAASSSNAKIFYSNGTANNIIIKNLKIDGNQANNTNGDGIRFEGTHTNILIDGVWVFDVEKNGIWLGGGDNANIRVNNCLVTGAFLDDGILIHTGTHFAISNCIVNNTVTNDNNNCISVFKSTGNAGVGSITNCVTTGGQNGFSIEGDSTDVVVSNCYAEDAGQHGFTVTAPTSATARVAFSNCIARNNSNRGFSCLDATNVSYSNCQSYTNVVGFYAGNNTELQYTGCMTAGNTNDGVSLGSGFHIFTTTDLNISGCHSVDGKANVMFLATITNGSVSSSIIKDATSNGIRFTSGSDILVQGNNFISNSVDIDKGTVTNLKIIGNLGPSDNPTEFVTTTNVITAVESGTTFYLQAAGGFTSTLPAPAAGLEYTFIVITAPTTAYIITTNASANVLYGTFLDIVGELTYFSAQDTINFVASTAVIGDRLFVESDGTNWYCTVKSGADGGITVAVT